MQDIKSFTLETAKKSIEQQRKPKKLTQTQLLDLAATEPYGPDNLRCQKCKAFQACQTPWVPTEKTEPGKVLLLFDKPSPEEDRNLLEPPRRVQVFGELYLRDLGIQPSQIISYSALACRCESKHPSAYQLRMCRPFLLDKIWQWKPSKIIAIGPYAAGSLLGETGPTIRDHTRRIYRLSWGYWSVPYIVTYDLEAGLSGSIESHGIRLVTAKHVREFLTDTMSTKDFPPMVRVSWRDLNNV